MRSQPLPIVLFVSLLAACNSPSAGAPATAESSAPAATATASAAPPAAAEPTATAVAEPVPAAPSATASAKAKPIAKADPKPKDTSSVKAKPAPDTSAAPVAPVAPVALGTPAPGSADEVAAQIDAVFDPLKTFKAKFKQEHTQKIAGITKSSTGTIFVEKPTSKVSFRYDAPNNNRIVSDGSLLKIYVADDHQMFTQPVAKTEYPGALAFIMGHGMRPSFTFTFNDKAKWDGGPVLSGKPRAATPYYDSVQFYVDKALLEKKDPGCVRRVLVVDAQGNRNRFDFEGSSAPPTIEDGEFKFDPPPGTNVTAQ